MRRRAKLYAPDITAYLRAGKQASQIGRKRQYTTSGFVRQRRTWTAGQVAVGTVCDCTSERDGYTCDAGSHRSQHARAILTEKESKRSEDY
jgi:hypothetical protein